MNEAWARRAPTYERASTYDYAAVTYDFGQLREVYVPTMQNLDDYLR